MHEYQKGGIEQHENPKQLIYIRSASVFRLCSQTFIYCKRRKGWTNIKVYAAYLTGNVADFDVLTSEEMNFFNPVFVPLGTMQRKRTATK